MRRGLVLGNWKMNGSRERNAELLRELVGQFAGYDQAEIGVCPSFPYLEQASVVLQGSAIQLGAQNVALAAEGAYTGEVSSAMLADVGCRYVLVGHSERRALYGETNDVVAGKFARAEKSGLVPVLCLGETLAQREGGETLVTVVGQLNAVIDLLGVGCLDRAVLAYEPVWAIGTGVTASPEQAQEVHACLRDSVAKRDCGVAERLRILYGGSVKAGNAFALFAMADIDGALCGGASLDANEFLAIARAAGSINYAS